MGNNNSTGVQTETHPSRDIVLDSGNHFDCDLYSQAPEQTLNQDTEPANALVVSTERCGLAPVKNALQ